MEFWTQLFSEWTAIPNALGLDHLVQQFCTYYWFGRV